MRSSDDRKKTSGERESLAYTAHSVLRQERGDLISCRMISRRGFSSVKTKPRNDNCKTKPKMKPQHIKSSAFFKRLPGGVYFLDPCVWQLKVTKN